MQKKKQYARRNGPKKKNCDLNLFVMSAERWDFLHLGLFTVVLFMAAGRPLPAQPGRNFQFYNDTTYQLYLAQDWKQLIPLSREAVREGYDFYYLRMRLGIAYQETGQSFRAVPQFYRALRFNRQDSQARSLLSAALRAGGRFDEARLHEPHSWWQWTGAGAEAGYQFSDRRTPVDDRYFAGVSLRHRLGRNLFLTHQYQSLTQRFLERELIILPPMGNRPPRQVIRTTERRLTQQEYWLAPAWQMSRGWRLEGGFRFLSFPVADGRSTEQLFAFGLRKDFPYFRLHGSGGVSHFDGISRRQATAGGTFFPFGNPNLYLGQVTTLSWENGGDRDDWSSLHLGWRLFRGSWLEIFYETGQIDYFFTHYGAFAYNIDDDLRERWGLSWQFWVADRHLLYAGFINEKKEWAADRTVYRHRTIMLGLSLNFN